jgi:hypothetical protein
VPQVRPTCPGVPWVVHGPKKMGAALRSLLPSDQCLRSIEYYIDRVMCIHSLCAHRHTLDVSVVTRATGRGLGPVSRYE